MTDTPTPAPALTDEQIDVWVSATRDMELRRWSGFHRLAAADHFDSMISAVEARAYRRALADARAAIACEDTVEWARRAAGSVISLPAVMEILDDLEADHD